MQNRKHIMRSETPYTNGNHPTRSQMINRNIYDDILCADFRELVNEKYNEPTRIYTDGSKKEEKVGYAVVTDQQSTRRRIRDQLSIFSVE
jgi:hypothetical protein